MTMAQAAMASLVVLSTLAGCSSTAEPASERGGSEFDQLFHDDQAARATDWGTLSAERLQAIHQADTARLARVKELIHAGALATPEDHYHAAMVLQHGEQPDDYLLAHVLASAAAIQGVAGASWLSAASLDRFLQNIDRPQWFGTQYRRNGSTTPWTQEPLSPVLSDSIRAAFGVPTLEAARKRLDEMNAKLALRSKAAESKPATSIP